MKKIRYLAFALCLLYVCFFTGCMFIDPVPAYEDRTYRNIEQAELDVALEELRSISQPGKTAKDFIRAFRKAESLLKELQTYVSMLSIIEQDNTEIAAEIDRRESLYLWFYYEFKNCELELAASPAKALILEAFGEKYFDKLSNFFITDDEQYALMEEVNRLEAQYNLLRAQGDTQGMIDLYVDLIKVRKKQAQNHGFDNYSEYSYIKNHERDYTLEQTRQLTEYAKKWLVPLYDDTLECDRSVLDKMFSEEEFMSLLDKTIELFGEKSLQNSLRHMKEKNLYKYSISPSNSTRFSSYLMPLYGDSYFNIQAAGSFDDYIDMMRYYARNAIPYLGDPSLYTFGSVTDLTQTFMMSMDALTVPLYSQLFGEEFAAAAKGYKAYYYTWVMLSSLAYDAFEQFAYGLDEETLNSPDIGDILNNEYKRLFEEMGITAKNRNFYRVSNLYGYPLYSVTFSVSILTAMQFAQPTINGVPSAEMYAKFAKYGECDLFMSVINDGGFESPFEESTVKGVAEAVIRWLEESGIPADLSDWPAA